MWGYIVTVLRLVGGEFEMVLELLTLAHFELLRPVVRIDRAAHLYTRPFRER